MDKTSIGDRMKEQYESRTRYMLPRRTNTIIRLDGKAFHTFTKNFKKPFDVILMHTMDMTARKLCEEIQGAKIAYIQSDEISILLTDYDDIKTEAWFNGNVQKIVSVSASIATSTFNDVMSTFSKVDELAHFDSRVFTIPDPEEVVNYFIWRQQDCTRNSVQMVGQKYFSHKELQNKSCNEIQEMLISQKNINWNNYSTSEKRGRCIRRVVNKWCIDNYIPIFTQDRNFIKKYLK